MGIGFKHGGVNAYPERVEVKTAEGTANPSGNSYTINCGFRPDHLAGKIGTLSANGKTYYVGICFGWESDDRGTPLATFAIVETLLLMFEATRTDTGAKITAYYYDGSTFKVPPVAYALDYSAVKYTK